ncbi:IS1634 family transposase [Brachybacterium sp. p3-SID957]|uniref:IS1634 family transposase n=1 Tax=Brachybacterium sp. p3-SID957 TaxID=2916049 RepID=UPI00223B8FBC|nr:IS1634 family transposase [Brachybacterium sp. p3-SID957]MCT1777255.1 IS1634 family transposase [Brachybacterium sp. p3-SID957]
MVFLRKVRTASGATAVQIAERRNRRDVVLEHLGSAHTEAELAGLMEAGREKINAGQGVLDLGTATSTSPATITSKQSRLLLETLQSAWAALGFTAIGDEAFFQLVAARLIEPTSMSDSARVLAEVGIDPVHRSTMKRCLARIATNDYRGQIATRCFEHAATSGDISLVLYDVTTLYFEAENEDALRKVGYSKERRVDPQIVVGLLVDRGGFPLEIGCFEGNHAETRTIVPIIRQFQARNDLADMVVVADAGMLSAANLRELDEADLKFIVGSRQTKAPGDLANHFHWNGDAFTDGQLIDTITPRHGNTKPSTTKRRKEPVWDAEEHPGYWRAIWSYRTKRATRDNHTLTAQENRARAVIDGDASVKSTRFVKTTASGRSLDTASLERARSLVGLKGYVTNIPAATMPAAEVVSSYHDLWHVEQSFRMSKTDLQARPMFHRTRDAIEAHLTIVFTALAIARHLQAATGFSIRRIIRTLRPLQDVTITIAGQKITASPELTDDARHVLQRVTH